MNKWNKENISELLQTNDKMVLKSLLQLYYRQTRDEQIQESTNHNNNQGFTSSDAKRLTSIAKWAIKTGFLTPKTIVLVRKRIMKYAGQLAKIANEKAEKEIKEKA